MDAGTVAIKVVVDDKTGDLKLIQQKVKSFGEEGSKSVSSLTDSFLSFKGVIAGVITSEITKFAMDAATAFAQAESATKAFTSLVGSNSEEIAKAMRKASNETVDASNAMAAANKALLMGINADYLPKLMEMAKAYSNITGMDTTQSFETLTRAISIQSERALKSMNIAIDSKKAYEDYAAAHNLVVEALTEEQRAEAFTQAAIENSTRLLEIGKKSVNEYSDSVQQLKASWNEVKETIGKGVAEESLPFIKSLNYLIKDVQDLSKTETGGKTSNIVSSVLGANMPFFNPIGTLAEAYTQSKTLEQAPTDMGLTELNKQITDLNPEINKATTATDFFANIQQQAAGKVSNASNAITSSFINASGQIVQAAQATAAQLQSQAVAVQSAQAYMSSSSIKSDIAVNGRTYGGWTVSAAPRIDKVYSNPNSSTGLSTKPMAEGGITTGPTNALIGEAGPEMVIPLSEAKNMFSINVGNINIQGGQTSYQTAQDIKRQLMSIA